jgi:hypothetical protein
MKSTEELVSMTLSEIVRDLEALSGDATIIAAKPWSPISRAEVVESPDDGRISNIERDGMAYFLEVFIAREFKEDWPTDRDDDAFCRRLIEYAINDA